jgi:hypothetical protein
LRFTDINYENFSELQIFNAHNALGNDTVFHFEVQRQLLNAQGFYDYTAATPEIAQVLTSKIIGHNSFVPLAEWAALLWKTVDTEVNPIFAFAFSSGST